MAWTSAAWPAPCFGYGAARQLNTIVSGDVLHHGRILRIEEFRAVIAYEDFVLNVFRFQSQILQMV